MLRFHGTNASMRALVLFLCAASAAFAVNLFAPSARAQDDAAAAVTRGERIYHAAGCEGCHTDVDGGGAKLAGGRALATPFGTFYGPNITPDPTHGIGNWTDADFVRALGHGVSPSGAHYFPAFPYPSFTKMTERDMLDLKAYIFAQEPVDRADTPHDITFPFGFRPLVGMWKWLFFEPGAFEPDPAKSETVNRGAYLVEALAHCGECHTERNILGATVSAPKLAGATEGPDGKPTPNITPDPEHGIGDWSDDEIAEFLASGFTPDGDVAGGPMGEVIEGLGKLPEDDLKAIAAYLKSLPTAGTANNSP